MLMMLGMILLVPCGHWRRRIQNERREAVVSVWNVHTDHPCPLVV